MAGSLSRAFRLLRVCILIYAVLRRECDLPRSAHHIILHDDIFNGKYKTLISFVKSGFYLYNVNFICTKRGFYLYKMLILFGHAGLSK